MIRAWLRPRTLALLATAGILLQGNCALTAESIAYQSATSIIDTIFEALTDAVTGA